MKKHTTLLSAAIAGAMLLAGCGKKDDTLNLFAWTEYVPQAVIDKFTAETGIKVALETYSSNEEMLAKLLAGGGDYDLIQPSEYTVEAMIKEDLL
ncbi:MAG: PotD/PotF family extracellular solute-binding protein, partial [Chthoniobacterales bacterium]